MNSKQAFLILAVLCSLVGAQTSISVSGTVRDRYSDAPIQGAFVSLVLSKLQDTSDAQGNFLLTNKPAAVRVSQTKHSTWLSKPTMSQGSLVFSNDEAGVVSIRICNLAGKQLFSLREHADKGVFRLSPGPLPAGVLVCEIRTPSLTEIFSFPSLKESGQMLTSAASVKTTPDRKSVV